MLIRTVPVAFLFAAFTLSAQPQFPQHSTGWPAPQLPLIRNHITALSGTVAGRPMPVRPGTPRIYPAPIYMGGWVPSQPYAPQPYPSQPTIFVNQQNIERVPPPVLVVNPDYTPEVARPVLREYSHISNPYENFQPTGATKVYLLALKDGSLRQSVAYWKEEQKLHYIRPDHKQETISLSELDAESTVRFNKERGIEFKQPE